MAMMDDCFAVIIGAGPAGSMAGFRFMTEDSTSRIIIVEKREDRSFEKYHRMCAEGISREAFDMTGAPSDHCVKNVIRSVREEWPGGIKLESEIDGLVIDRPNLLKWMKLKFEKLGGESVQGHLIDVEKKGSGFIIKLEDNNPIFCRYLIGADGAHSSVRRLMFGSSPDTFMPVEQYLIEGEGKRDEIVLKYDQAYKGKYSWSFPSGDKTKIGFPKGSQNAPEQYLERHVREIPVGKVPQLVSGNAALIGDAAGLANAVTFGGLRTSFQSATLLVKSIMGGNISEYDGRWAMSNLANPCYLDTFHMIRNMNNDQMAALVEPLRYGPNMTSIMTALMNDTGFQKFYRSHVRKLSDGW
jgi:digeranylgeranylglycerophospholipid reductase